MRDVLVIGGGPAGSACAYWLADAGWDVVVVEKKQFPREKTCGDGLTPRAVRQIADMGLEGELSGAHKFGGLRAHGWGHVLEMEWPAHPVFPSYGYTITRHDLDALVAERAAKAGAEVLQGTEAVEPLVVDGGATGGHHTGANGKANANANANGLGPDHDDDRLLPYCAGAVVKNKSGETREIRARYVVVADGSNSRIGRALGAGRRKGYPLGMALRGYYRSARHDDPYIESHLDIRDAAGEAVPGYGWIFPLGDGRVNVGVGLLSTDQRWKGLNTSKLMETFVAQAPASWGLTPESSCGPPTGGKLPMSMAVGPHYGPNVLLAGDAGGSINPFNGEGIAYGYETGRLAAVHVGRALAGEGPAGIEAYGRHLEDAYGPYYRVGRAFVRLISNPEAMRRCVSLGMRSERLMMELLRIMANLMRPERPGAAEVGYDLMIEIARMLPEEVL